MKKIIDYIFADTVDKYFRKIPLQYLTSLSSFPHELKF